MKKKGATGTYYARLRVKIITITVLVALIPVPLVAVSFANYYQTYIRGAVVRELTTLANSRKEAIELFLRERATLLRTLAYSRPLSSLTTQAELARIHEVLKAQAAGLSDLGVIDSSGRHLAYSGPYEFLLGRNYSQAKWFQEAASKGVSISDTFLGYRQVPHMVIAVRRDEGASFWVLRATIDAAAFQQLVRSAQLGRSGDAFVVNRDWEFQVPPRFPQQARREPRLLETALTATAVAELGPSSREMVFQAATWLNNGRWLLVVREDSSAEFFNLESAKRIAVLVFVLALLAVSVTVVLITNKLIRRLEAHEAETERLHAQLEQSNRLAALGKFAAGLAHEINNPLAIIKESAGWMKELLEGEAKDAHEQVEELKPCIEDIRGAVRRCRDVTRHLLDFARSYEVKLGPTDVNRALTDAVQFLYKGASIRNVKVHTDLQDIPLVASDSAQLQQVFLNLLDNALYALNQRGDGNITVRSRAWEAGVRISIADDGPGIPRELRGKLFDPFFTTKPVGQGTGLGLSICYGIVGKLGGRLWVEHPPEGGATFHVYLPTAGPQKEAGG